MIFLLLLGILTGMCIPRRNHGAVSVNANVFEESDRKLANPNCGFYSIYGYVITDEAQDFPSEILKKMGKDEKKLALIQVNLGNYRDGAVSEQGMENVNALFQALSAYDKCYIVRFLYDWEGKGEESEPDEIETILTHIRQMGEIFANYKDIILVHQGIFVGNWGEMHGSKYLSGEDMNRLMNTLLDSAEEQIYLSVRTPQQWRMLGADEEEKRVRIGLFNDGILGTDLDYGTYGTKKQEEAGIFGKWTREEELDFQETLCEHVINGGEVMNENPLNNLETAIEAMKTMHITYLNRDYDTEVLDKWADTIITEDGCFQGMNGLDYMERHLGYRFFIKEAAFEYEWISDEINIELGLQNVGFAPLYRRADLTMTFYETESGECRTYPLEEDLRVLAGGNTSGQILTIEKTVLADELTAGQYEVYFSIKDVISGKQMMLANVQDADEKGYLLGTITIEPKRWGEENAGRN